jgi:hypothetical protein
MELRAIRLSPTPELWTRNYVLDGMRGALRTVTFALLLLAGLCASAAAKPHPVALHLRWRLITTEPGFIASNDRYVAIVEIRSPNAVSPIILIDEQQRTRQTLTPPGCPQPQLPMLGGGHLLVVCDYPGGLYALFDLATSKWTTVKASCPPGSACRPAGVGRYWLKLATDTAGCIEHCFTSYLMQELGTGTARQDPATPGGRIYDDLDAPTGSVPLCSPVRYPRVADDSDHWELGQLTFEGRFVLSAGTKYTVRDGLTTDYRLRRCGSALNLQIPAYPPVLISSRGVIWQSSGGEGDRPARLAGRFLPGLRPFTAEGAPLPTNPYLAVRLAALTRRTIYMRADGGDLWAATLP